MKKTRAQINETERQYWNESKLKRAKIKPLRRHSFHFSYKKEERVVQDLLKSAIGKDILELGSNTWTYWIKYKFIPNNLTCINISEKELKKGMEKTEDAKFNVDFKIMDANKLDFPDNSFDFVIGGAILHHLDIEQAISEVSRVLKPGGKILFQEPLNINPLYRLYRYFNPQERTPDEHALVVKDFSRIGNFFKYKLYGFDFFSVITGFLSYKIYGDKKYDNFINKIGYNLDNIFSVLPFTYLFFARVLIYGEKR